MEVAEHREGERVGGRKTFGSPKTASITPDSDSSGMEVAGHRTTGERVEGREGKLAGIAA